jgi:uncharacterized protein YcfJ
MKKFSAVIPLLAVLIVSGCASMGENTKKGAAIGGLAGAAVGGIVGYQNGHGLAGALIGGATGATAGGVLGNQADQNVRNASTSAAASQLSVVDVARMGKEGVPEDVIIGEIDRTHSKFSLNSETITYLKTNNISDHVIDHMLASAK